MLNGYKRITYLGSAAFIFLGVTVFLGVTGINFKIHKITGLLTFVLAALHFAMAANKNSKIRK